QDAIVPAAVGVDIGCGMMAAQTPLDADRVAAVTPDLKRAIEAAVPTGFNVHRVPTGPARAWKGWAAMRFECEDKLRDRAMHQLGTLGGGNHFIEVSVDEDRRV